MSEMLSVALGVAAAVIAFIVALVGVLVLRDSRGWRWWTGWGMVGAGMSLGALGFSLIVRL